MLLAEEFVLLALNPDGSLARGVSNQDHVGLGVTGALITELVQGGHVELPEGRIRLTGTRPSEPVLAQALDSLVPHEGKKLKKRFDSIEHAGWSEVVDTMIDAGVLGRVKEGLHLTRHPVADAAAHAALLDEVRSAARGDEPMSARVASLLALAGPAQLLEVVAPDTSDRKKARKRIAEATQETPAAEAVQYVVDAMVIAIAVVIAAAAAAG